MEEGPQSLIKILNEGLDHRTMRETEINESSSRSHLMFKIIIWLKHKKTGKKTIGKL